MLEGKKGVLNVFTVLPVILQTLISHWFKGNPCYSSSMVLLQVELLKTSTETIMLYYAEGMKWYVQKV